jgi:hypothetical protein
MAMCRTRVQKSKLIEDKAGGHKEMAAATAKLALQEQEHLRLVLLRLALASHASLFSRFSI